MEAYQDQWVKGKRVAAGRKECAGRYELIKAFCAQYRRPFTVLDVGSCMSYFIVRLAEDFPECTSVGIESMYVDWGLDVLRKNENPRAMLLKHHASTESLRKIGFCEHFDVVLCLSTLHWMKGDLLENFEALRDLGDHLIVEIPTEPQACGQAAVRAMHKLPEGNLLGYGRSHLNGSDKRPIVHYERPKTTLKQSYLAGSGSHFKIEIDSDFDHKTVHFPKKQEKDRNWLRGINLNTFDKMSGVYPETAHITQMLVELGLPDGVVDAKLWNVVLQGDAVHWIDLHGNPDGSIGAEYEAMVRDFKARKP